MGYVLSLSLMLVLANIQFGGAADGKNNRNFRASSIDFSEPLPLITVQEVPQKQSETPALERREPNRELPPVELDLAYETVADSEVLEAPPSAPVLKPAVLAATADFLTIGGSKRMLRSAIEPPRVDREPKIKMGSMIVRYPLAALKKAVEGLVIVKFVVETDGRAHAIQIVHGLHPACDTEVVQALQMARFVPGRHRGRAVPAHSQMTVRFVLADVTPTGAGFKGW